MAEKVIMSWSKCDIEIGETGANDAPAIQLTNVGVVKDKTSSLAAENGDTLEAKATGGELIGYEQQPGTLTITTTIIEPSDALYDKLGLGSASSGSAGSYDVKTHIVGKEFTVKISPKKVGAKGILAPKCSVSVQPAWDEENGRTLILTFGVLKSQVLDYWYQMFTVK